MLSDWSITGTRGRSLIYHLIHPNSHPDVLWPLFTLSLTHIHTYTDMQIHYLGSPVISTLSPLPILLFNTHTHTQSRKLDHWCLHYFCQAVPVTMGLIIYQHTHTQASEGGACDLSGIEKASSTADFKDAYLGFVCF